MHTVRIATNPRKWRRPAPCPACRKSRPLILTLGTIYNLRTRKPVNTIYGCICPNCRHKCILHVDGRSLKKAIDQELEAVRAATRDGNTPFGSYAQTRHNAFLYARDEIRKALAAAVDERGAGNPFLPQRDELVTQDMHTCDLCGRWCSSPVYSVGLIYGGQAKTFTEVCADCMRRLKFQPVKTIPLDIYRLFEKWLDEQKETER